MSDAGSSSLTDAANLADGAKRAKLLWRCRRGMRELDEAMRAYLDYHYDDATEGERADFEGLLAMQDPELYRQVCGKDKDERYASIIAKITATLGGEHSTVAAP
mgnify:CR=1 FL=1